MTLIKKSINLFVLLLLINGVVLGWAAMVTDERVGQIVETIPEGLKLKAPIDKILDSREVDWIEPEKDKDGKFTGKFKNKGKIRSYDYITDKKVTGEFLWNGRNYTNAIVEKKEGDKMTARFYSGDHFYKDTSGDVYEIEHGATTTIDAFNAQLQTWQAEQLLGGNFSDTTYALLLPTYTQGSTKSGVVASTTLSDDTRLVTNDSGGSGSAKWKLDFTFDGVSPSAQWEDCSGLNMAGIQDIQVDMEAKDNLSTDSYYAMMWNFTTGAWVEAGAVMSIGTTESSYTRNITSGATYDAKDYLNASCEMKLRIANAKALGKAGYPDNDGELAIDYLAVTITNSTDTFYPSPDGTFNLNSGTSNWSTAVNAAESTNLNQAGTEIYVQEYQSSNWQINRIGLIYDTSAIGSGSPIASATQYLYKDNSLYSNADPDSVVITSFAPANDSTWVIGDFDSFGTTSYGSLAFANFTGSALDPISLNASGLSAINKTGNTKFGLRGNKDVSVSAPSGDDYITFFATEKAGTSQDPYLSVTYTAGSGTTPNNDLIIFDEF